MHRYIAAFLLAAGSTTLAQGIDSTQLPVEPMVSVEVGYISGGNDPAERARMEEMSEDFNLQLTMMEPGGGYNTAGAVVKIVNSSGETLVQAVSEGPLFYADLEPGAYTVIGEYQGNVQKRAVSVDEDAQKEITLQW